jgi:hypothetical protein
MGNWNSDVKQAAYSGQLPVKVLRCGNGFDEAKSSHFYPRKLKIATNFLKLQIFSWVEGCQEAVEVAERRPGGKLFPRPVPSSI